MQHYWKANPLVSLDFLTKLPLFPGFSPHERIVLVVPHPDDETLGCGGLVQKITTAQLPFTIVMVSDGNRRGKKVRRRGEVIRAMAHCGLRDDQFVFLDFPDGKLASTPEIHDALKHQLEALAPTMVIVTDPEDIHDDHAVLGVVVEQLCEHIKSIQQVWGFLIHYHRFPRPLGRMPHAPLLPPGRLVSADRAWVTLPLDPNEQAIKRQAIREFKSQLFTPFLRGLMFSFDRPNEIYRRIWLLNPAE